MTPERWQRIGALFDRALELAAPDREPAVRASGEQADIQDEVLALLRSHESNAAFLEPASLLEPGAKAGPYTIQRILGRGGMGVVYLAEDSRLHRLVALKALPPHVLGDERLRAKLRKEARAAASLTHPSIATVFALEEIDGHVFIATEYLEGETLRASLASGPLPLDEALAIGRALADALVTAHARGIVHRDLKPENIVRTSRTSAKILDFGLAQIDPAVQEFATVANLTDSGTIAGTPLYMAPEQLLGKATSAKTDQFAFGVVLYELITGKHPFGNGSLPSSIARMLAGDPDVPANMPPGIWNVIKRCLERDPESRFATTEDLARALAPGSAHPVTPAPRHPGTLNLWWWEAHQLTVFFVYWLMVYPAWAVHHWTGRAGVITFLATLVAVIVSGNMRLHLWFTSRTYPDELAALRASSSVLIRGADFAFALLMTGTGLVIAGNHTGWGALFVSVGLGAALAFLMIEPTTARAAFREGK